MSRPFEALIPEFLLDTRERVGSVENLLVSLGSAGAGAVKPIVDRLKRDLHTLKGNSGMMGFTELQELAHSMEDRVAQAKKGDIDVAGILKMLDDFRSGLRKLKAPGEEDKERDVEALEADAGDASAAELHAGSVRVPFTALDELINLLGEMIIFRNRVSDAISVSRRLDPQAADFVLRSREAGGDVELAYEALTRSLEFIQDRILRLRLVPLGTLFGSLNRLVFDEAQKEGKKINFTTEGGDTPLDKALLELANEALGHLVRNSVIHGIERPARRTAAGKPRNGNLRVSASSEGNEVLIKVSDDGRGLDSVKLLASAREKGIDTADIEDPYSLLFMEGFSTKVEADMSAGRGMGLSAVREAVRNQGGRIETSSQVGVGTSFLLRLPLTVSISRCLLLGADEEEYALPLDSVVESRKFESGDGHQLNNAGVYQWRDSVIPLLDLGYSFGTSPQLREKGYVIVIESHGKQRGLVADVIRGIQDIVVKGLDPIVGDPAGISGSTILGDGRPILILDPRSLVEIEPFVETAV